MPNTGKPSADCNLCRARRVKCDLTRPACLRCVKYGATCPGYRVELDLLFHNEDVATVQRRKKKKSRKGPASAAPPDASASSSGDGTPSPDARGLGRSTAGTRSLVRSTPPGVSPRPSFDLQLSRSPYSPSMNIVLERFAFSENGRRSWGWLQFLPSLFDETKQGSCLSLAADLFADACQVRGSGAAPNERHNLELYGRSLHSVHAALAHPTRSLEDQTVAAIWLLGHYEIITGSPHGSRTPAPVAWQAHTDGLASILRARGADQFTTVRGRALFWLAFSIVQTGCIISNTPFPPESHEWLSTAAQNLAPDERLCHRLTMVNMEACSILAGVAQFAINVGKEDARLALPSLLSRIAVLEATAPNLDCPVTLLTGRDLHTWNLVWTARLKLNHWAAVLIGAIYKSTHPDIAGKFDPATLRQRQARYIERAREIGDAILETVPVTLGTDLGRGLPPGSRESGDIMGCWSGGMRMVWPMTLVGRLTSLLPRQHDIALKMLKHIGVQLGIKLALIDVPRHIYFPAESMWVTEVATEGEAGGIEKGG